MNIQNKLLVTNNSLRINMFVEAIFDFVKLVTLRFESETSQEEIIFIRSEIMCFRTNFDFSKMEKLYP